MTAYFYDFNGTDTADGTGIPVPAGHPAFTQVNGSWRRYQNRAYTSTARSEDPIIAVQIGSGDVDLSVSISNSGGDCLYIRVTDSNNWIRLRLRKYQTSYQYYQTQYQWFLQHWEASIDGNGSHTHSQYKWGWDQFSSPFTSGEQQYSHSHSINGSGSSYFHLHDDNEILNHYYTGQTQQVGPYTGYTDNWRLYLEKSVSGTVTELGNAGVSSGITSIRLRAVGSSIKAYFNGLSGEVISVTDSTHSAVNWHGLGRGDSDYNGHALDNFNIDGLNSAPNAPSPTAPSPAAIINRASTQRFDWDYSDPDVSDAQSAYNLRYRVVGAGTWTETGWITTPNTYRDVVGGTFAAGDYEWQVATKDSGGLEGPYSTSAFFTAADAPAGPTITDPINDGTIGTETYDVDWSVSDQDAYQLRTVADNASSPDTGTVYYDTGEVTSTGTRTHVTPFATNGRTEHVQVRVKDGGLWSDWASVKVNVSYTGPAVPTFTFAPDHSFARLAITITNPVPSGSEPTVTHNDVYIDDGDGEERKATGVAPNESWTYKTPKSGRNYDGYVRVVAMGDNGTSTSSG